MGLCANWNVTLAALSLACLVGYCVDGQKEAILSIVEEYKILASYEQGYALWPGQYSFESYLSGDKSFLNNDNRMSWCYGSIGILRVLKLAAKALDNQEMLDWNKKQIDIIANLPTNKYLLVSPTICHGYAGRMALLALEFKEFPRQTLKTKIIELADIIIAAYKFPLQFGYENTETVYSNGILEETYSYGNGFLDGAAGCLLALISLLKENTNWEIHLLAK